MADGPRTRREQALFWVVWLLGPALGFVAGFFANPWFGRIWTPDAEPWIHAWCGPVFFGGSVASALGTVALCALRGGPRRQPECWLLLAFWVCTTVLVVASPWSGEGPGRALSAIRLACATIAVIVAIAALAKQPSPPC